MPGSALTLTFMADAGVENTAKASSIVIKKCFISRYRCYCYYVYYIYLLANLTQRAAQLG